MVIFTRLFLGFSVTKLVRKFSWFSCKLNPKLVAFSPLPSLVKEKETLLPGIFGMIFRSGSFRSMIRESLIPWFPDAGGAGGDGWPLTEISSSWSGDSSFSLAKLDAGWSENWKSDTNCSLSGVSLTVSMMTGISISLLSWEPRATAGVD